MTRKPLPKAITRPLREFATSAVVDQVAPVRPAAAPFDTVVAEPALAISSAAAANDPAPELSDQARALAAKRRSLAQKIVDRHRTFAAFGGLVPLPLVNVASVAAVNLRMIKQLSKLYQVPFQRDRTRALIVGLIGGAVPSGLGAATSSTLMWIIPGGLLLGLGVSAVTARALTRGIGLVFIESFETGALPGGTR